MSNNIRSVREQAAALQIPSFASSRRGRVVAVIVWSIAMALVITIGAIYWRAQGARELLPDEGIYSYIGWAWVSGDVIFRDAWEQKGPVVYAFPALRILLAGNAPEWVGAQELVLGAIAAIAVAATASMLWGSLIGAFVLVLDTVLWTQLSPKGGLVSTAGCVIAMITTLGVLALVKAMLARSTRGQRLALVAFGIAQGLLFWSRPNAIVTLALAPLLFSALPRLRAQWLRNASLIAAGVAISLGGVAVWLHTRGALPAMLDIYFRFGPIRSRLGLEGIGPIGVLRRMFEEYARLALLPTFATIGLIGVAVAVRLRRGHASAPLSDSERVAFVIVPFWFGLELLGYFSSAAYNHHALPSLPAVALASGWALHATSDVLTPRVSHLTRCAVVAGLALLLAGRPLVRAIRMPHGGEKKTDWRRVADVVARTTRPHDRILTITGFAGPAILTTAKRLSAVPWTFPMPLHARGYVTDSMWARVADVLDGPQAVQTVIADLMSIPPTGPGDSTVAWTLKNVDRGLTSDMYQGGESFPNKERVKRLLVQHYAITHCDQKVCLLSRRKN